MFEIKRFILNTIIILLYYPAYSLNNIIKVINYQLFFNNGNYTFLRPPMASAIGESLVRLNGSAGPVGA